MTITTVSKKSIKELSSIFVKSICYDDFVTGKYEEDETLNYHIIQKCWYNQCWVITPYNENNPILMNFYSKDKIKKYLNS